MFGLELWRLRISCEFMCFIAFSPLSFGKLKLRVKKRACEKCCLLVLTSNFHSCHKLLKTYSRTSKGNENQFKKAGVKLQKSLSKGSDFWFEKLGGLRNQSFKKSGFHCVYRFK